MLTAFALSKSGILPSIKPDQAPTITVKSAISNTQSKRFYDLKR